MQVGGYSCRSCDPPVIIFANDEGVILEVDLLFMVVVHTCTRVCVCTRNAAGDDRASVFCYFLPRSFSGTCGIVTMSRGRCVANIVLRSLARFNEFLSLALFHCFSEISEIARNDITCATRLRLMTFEVHRNDNNSRVPSRRFNLNATPVREAHLRDGKKADNIDIMSDQGVVEERKGKRCGKLEIETRVFRI